MPYLQNSCLKIENPSLNCRGSVQIWTQARIQGQASRAEHCPRVHKGQWYTSKVGGIVGVDSNSLQQVASYSLMMNNCIAPMLGKASFLQIAAQMHFDLWRGAIRDEAFKYSCLPDLNWILKQQPISL